MTEANQAAFATGTDNWNQEGLTKREYFAAMAMQGILSSGRVIIVDLNLGELSVKQADALIDALNEAK